MGGQQVRLSDPMVSCRACRKTHAKVLLPLTKFSIQNAGKLSREANGAPSQ